MTKEQDFWNRILELAHAQLKQTTYDFFVAEAKLVKVEEKQAVIFLDSPVKQLFWEQNLVGVILTAGFEIFNDQIAGKYIFEEETNIDTAGATQLDTLCATASRKRQERRRPVLPRWARYCVETRKNATCRQRQTRGSTPPNAVPFARVKT